MVRKVLFAALTAAVVGLVALTAAVVGAVAAGTQPARDGAIRVTPRTIGVVDIIQQSPIDQQIDNIMLLAGKKLGWKIDVIDAAGDPRKVVNAMQTFITRNVDGIVLLSIAANNVRAQLAAARAKGIPVIEIGAGVVPSTLWSAQYGEDEARIARTIAEYIVKHDPNAKIADLKTHLVSNAIVRAAELRAVVKAQGKASIVAETEVDLSNPVVNTQKAVTDMLTAHPDITAIHAVFDNMAHAAIQTVIRKRSKAKVYSYFTAPETVANLRKDTPLQAVADVNLALTGAIAIDQLARFYELKTPIDQNAVDKHPLTYLIVDRSNVDRLLRNKKVVFPVEQLLAPFVKRWQNEFSK